MRLKVKQNLKSMGCPFKKDGTCKDLWWFVCVAKPSLSVPPSKTDIP